MEISPSHVSSASSAAAAGQTISASVIRFVANAPAGVTVRREFKEPCRMVAVEETVALADLPAAKPWPEPTDHFYIVFVPSAAATGWLPSARDWMAPPQQSDAV